MDGRVDSVIIFGKLEYARILILETALDFAEQGNPVLCISPEEWQNLPAIFHDREKPEADTLKKIKFMYLPDYESLVDKLIDLHKFSTIPSVLLIDNLDNYLKPDDPEESIEFHSAKLCATVLFALHNCLKVSKRESMKFCSSVRDDSYNHIFRIYFKSFWTVFTNESEIIVTKNRDKHGKSFKYKQLQNNVLILKEIIEQMFE